jgi:serine/threonine protein kinase/Tfp pilus assembly protein PilF
MEPERWKEIDRVFAAALEQDTAERPAFLDEACRSDSDLRIEVESLLAHVVPGSLVANQALEEATRLLGSKTTKLRWTNIGPYPVVKLLGVGGMGEVYLARDPRLNRLVAVKVLSRQTYFDDEAIKRFHREALAASALNHPNILTIHEISEFEGHSFITTEFVDGLTLRERLREPLSISQALDIAMQTADALSAAHAAGIIHRDIKPENVMVRADGWVKVLDFGIAKYTEPGEIEDRVLIETRPGSVIGTAPYMSPEQARGLKVDARTDIWSLGVMIYEAVTNRKPFWGATGPDVIAAVLEHEPAPVSDSSGAVPPALDSIISKALQKNVDLRYQTATELLADLEDLKAQVDSDAAVRLKSITVQQTVSIKATSAGIAASPALRTIAVLPFKPLIAEDRDASLEVGMADTLIAKLSNSRGIIVRPLGSVRKYRELDQDPVAAGRELGVDTLLEGNIQRAGDLLRVTVRLIRIPSGESLWAGTFDEKFTSIFTVHDAISQRVAEALAVQLTTGEHKRLTRRDTESPAAYELYLKGRYHWNKITFPQVRKGIEYFQQAIDIDPLYAMAYAGLAEAYRSLPINSDIPPRDAFPKAKAAAALALEIDPHLAEVHASLVFIKSWFDWDWAGAEVEAKLALDIDPNSASANRAYAHLLSATGRHQEAVLKGARARELDPLALITRTLEGQYLYYAGNDEEAAKRLTEALELDHSFWVAHLTLAKVYIRREMYSEANQSLTIAKENSGANSETTSLIGYTWALAGDERQARASLAELENLSKQRYVPPYNFAMIHNGLNESAEAFAWLEKAYDERDVRLTFINVDPKWNSFRSDSRFISLIKRIGFPNDIK